MNDLQGEIMPARKPSLKCRLAMIVITAVTVAFLAGYAVGNHRSDERCYDSAREQMLEFIRLGSNLGFLSVDHQKLGEIICSVSESQGEEDAVSTNEASISTNETAGGDHLKEND